MPLKDLIKQLQQQPYKFDFYQVMRRLECANRTMPRWGQSEHPSEDPIRLGQQPSLAFPPAALAAFEPAVNGDRARLEVLFFGLFGPNGPLPLHLTQYARDRLLACGTYGRRQDTGEPLAAPDRTFSRFADVFHHRLLCLFYRVWAEARPTVSFDRYRVESGLSDPRADKFASYVGALCGLGMASLRNRDSMPDVAKLHFAGRLAAPGRNTEGLVSLLAHVLFLPRQQIQIEPFVGHWMQLPTESRWELGRLRNGLETAPVTSTLGETATLGDAVWNCQHKFRIRLGPLDWTRFLEFLPGGQSLERLVAVVRNYVNDELGWELDLVLAESAFLPPDAPGNDARPSPWFGLGTGTCLGYTAWVLHEHVVGDADDVKLQYGVDAAMPNGLGHVQQRGQFTAASATP